MSGIQIKDIFLDFGILFGNFWDQSAQPIIILLGIIGFVLLIGALVTFITTNIRKING